LVCRFSLILKDAAAFPLYCQQITQLMRGGSKNETISRGGRYIYRSRCVSLFNQNPATSPSMK
jgi:hypothetical protein